MKRSLPALGLTLLALGGCAGRPAAPLPPLPVPARETRATPRINGPVGAPDAVPPAELSLGTPSPARGGLPGAGLAAGGSFSLDFADTDIREVAAQILGNMLQVNYTIDPAVHGTATLHTASPVSRADLLPTLQALLAQNGAAVVQSGPVYRVLPTAAAASAPGLAAAGGAGETVVPLRYAPAEELAKVLQPFVGAGAKLAPEGAQNALVISGEPAGRDALAALARSFDTDMLAGQSYALLPVSSGDARELAGALQQAMKAQPGGPLASTVRVVPLERVNAVLVTAPDARIVAQARRVYGLLDRQRRRTVRSWHVYYLQNGRSNDVAYVLQQAFTPNHVTAQPTPSGPAAQAPGNTLAQTGTGGGYGGMAGGLGGMAGGSGLGGGTLGGGALGGYGGGAGFGQTQATRGAATAPDQSAAPGGAGGSNPLLGGLDQASPDSDANAMRIIPNTQNNALLVYATPDEEATVEGMLRKIDILPLQVRIDATIAEVDLNDQLQYGLEYFFAAGVNGLLSTSGTRYFGPFSGFSLTGPAGQSAALHALQDITHVRVLSSPQLTVVDNEPAHLQVGQLVPVLTGQSQSTLTSGAPIVSSITYQPTGVILQVTPRVNSGGLVTLDVSQEVSSVVPASSSSGSQATTQSQTSSPTFQERQVQSRLVVQDGQTVGLAGLIQDQDSRENSGIPFLKDIPVLGLLAGSQNNVRTRTELLVLITPHVIHDQRDARALTEDLREGLRDAAAAAVELPSQPATGSGDPGAPVRRRLGIGP